MTSRTSSERLMSVQFMSCVYGGLIWFLLMLQPEKNLTFQGSLKFMRMSTEKNPNISHVQLILQIPVLCFKLYPKYLWWQIQVQEAFIYFTIYVFGKVQSLLFFQISQEIWTFKFHEKFDNVQLPTVLFQMSNQASQF